MHLPYKIVLPITILFLLTSCAVGPNYKRPCVNTPVKYKEAKGKTVIVSNEQKNWKIAQPQDDFDHGEWWKIFGDPKLNELEDRLNRCNQTVANAYHNYQEARAIVDQARAGFFPTVGASLTAFRQKQGGGTTTFISSSTSAGGTTTGISGTGSTSSIRSGYAWLFNASWEPDLWGSVRRTVEANAAAAQSSAALLASTRLSAQGSLAQYYFQLRGLDADQKFLDDTVIDYRKALKLTQNQYNAGVAGRSDVLQAQSQLQTAEASAINNRILRAQYEHAIAVLIGVPPAELSITPLVINLIPPPIPLEFPSALLERRPDVAQAERVMAQTNAQIGVAKAAFFPNITLSPQLSASTSQLFIIDSFNWALSATMEQTVFDGGLRAATVNAAKSAYCASVASYRQTVLAAFQDVEDNLVSLQTLNDQAIVQEQAAMSAKKSLQLMINQYKSGTVAYSDVITAQINAYSAEKSAIDINYQRMNSAVGLIKALGGGWNSCCIEHAADWQGKTVANAMIPFAQFR